MVNLSKRELFQKVGSLVAHTKVEIRRNLKVQAEISGSNLSLPNARIFRISVNFL
jgi:hypothetical protein